MASRIGQDSRESGSIRSEKPTHSFPENTHTKHQPHSKPADSADHRVLSSEAVGAGHLDFEHRLSDFGGFPADEVMGTGSGTDEGINGTPHIFGKRPIHSER